MKILFLQESPMYESLGIQAIAGVVEAGGHECDLLIESEEEDLERKTLELKPDLLAFSFMTRQHEWAISTINRIRHRVKIPILMGGSHPTMYPETLGQCAADFLCVGEGELPTLDLLNRMKENARTDDVPNIHAKVNGQLIRNEIRPLMSNWDDLAFPDRDVYHRYPFLKRLPLKRFITSFGCPYKCSFCYINNYREIYADKGKFFRRKSVSRVIEEIRRVIERVPLKRVYYVDDIFSTDPRWVRDFLPVYRKEIGLPWTANVWIAHMNEDMVRLFKENGCASLTFGVESGNEKTRLGMIDKNIPDDVYLKHCGYLKRHGIRFHTSNIVGLPGEGLDEAYETARFNRRIGATSTRSNLFWPFPGTNLTQYAIDYGMLSADYGVEMLNQGVYPKVKHEQVEELTTLTYMFHLVAKWSWFERLSRFLLKWPTNTIVRTVAKLLDQSYWIVEARFYGLLNWEGLKYYWRTRRALASLRRHAAKDAGGVAGRALEDAKAQRPLWHVSQNDIDSVYKSSQTRNV